MKKSTILKLGAAILLVVIIGITITMLQIGKAKDKETGSIKEVSDENKDPNGEEDSLGDTEAKDDLIDAYQKIQIENFFESEGVVVEECSDDKGESIGGVKDGFYTAYKDVDFGDEGAKRVAFRVATPMQGGDIEIHLDSLDGKLIGTCKVNMTGPDWHSWVNVGCDVEEVTGVHDIYLVYKGEDYLFNINWFRFAKGEGKPVESVKLNNNSPMVGDMLVGTVTPANAIVSYQWLVDGEQVSIGEKYTVAPGDINKKIQVKVTGLGYSNGELQSSETWEVVPADYQLNVEEVAYQSFTSFNDKFYYYSNTNKFGLFLHTEFWDQAEIYEIVIDAYEHTGDERYKTMIYDIFKGFNLHNGSDWSGNEYNDDIMWMVIACTRAYMATGDEMFLDTAKNHFAIVWDRGWSDDLGGGIWWRTDNQTKNACINNPAAIAACLLGDALGDESYYEKAVQIMDWVVANIYEEDGHVYDSYNLDGDKNHWASTYNQGTFIGANALLFEHFGDEIYYNRARAASDYTIKTMFSGGVMNNEDNSGDLIGFKGILCRWMYRFAVNNNQQDIMEWLKMNAATAWNNRNTAGLIWTKWNEKTDDTTDYDIFGLSTAVSLLNNCRTNTNLVFNAADRIEIEAFDLCRGIITNECLEGGKSIGGITGGTYTVYHNVDFGDGSFKKAQFRAASTASGGTVEIRLGSTKGKLLGTCQIENTGDLGVWDTFSCDVTDVTGMQDIYLVYSGDDNLFNLNWFQFVK
ncbi:MAG: glycoside hydrolase family 76 [Herbinix sp.]|jgi:predicted alpha-1,6-mannanase (GH76 family)|nr:glycoside hydrolase family 76 [Herbinix sp.]